jgi:hypothetical protein
MRKELKDFLTKFETYTLVYDINILNDKPIYSIAIFKLYYDSEHFNTKNDTQICKFIYNTYSYESFEEAEEGLIYWIPILKRDGEFEENKND